MKKKNTTKFKKVDDRALFCVARSRESRNFRIDSSEQIYYFCVFFSYGEKRKIVFSENKSSLLINIKTDLFITNIEGRKIKNYERNFSVKYCTSNASQNFLYRI